MKLWTEGAAGGAGKAIRATVKKQVANIDRQVLSRGTRAVNALRKAELEVLKGERSGKVYKKPGTYGKATKATKKLMKDYGHRLKGGQLYRASAPGEAPAKRNGDLRMHWSGQTKTKRSFLKGTTVIAELESQEKYAYYLEKGIGMAPRPFVDRIKEKALPEIEKIYKEPYK